MRKKLKIFFVVGAVLITLAALLPFLLPQSTYQNWFISQVEESLALRLKVETFRLRLLPLPSLKLDQVEIDSKNPPFANQRLAKARQIEATIGLRNLLKKEAVMAVKLKDPVLYFRTVGDQSNFQNLLIPSENQKQSTSKSSWGLKVSSFVLENGRIESPKYSVEDINISLKNLSFAGVSNIPFLLSFAPTKEKPFSLKGDFKLDTDRERLTTKNLKVKFGNFEGAGKFNASLKTFVTSGELISDSFTYEEYPLKNIRLEFVFDRPRLHIKNLSTEIFGAKGKGDGELLFQTPLNYDLNFNLDEVDLAQLPFLKKQIVGKGKLKAGLFGKIVEGREAKRDFNANGEIEVNQGAIPSLKLGQEIFGHSVWNILTPLAGFNKQALNSLKELDAKVEKLIIPFEVRNGITRIIDGSWQHPRYVIRLNGTVAFNKQLSGSGAFVLPAAELNQLVEEPAVKKHLADGEGRLVLPFFIGGHLDKPQVTPDKKTLVPRFTKAVAARGIDSIKKSLPAPVEMLKGIFGQ